MHEEEEKENAPNKRQQHKYVRSFVHSRSGRKMNRKIRKLHKWPTAIVNLSLYTPCWFFINSTLTVCLTWTMILEKTVAHSITTDEKYWCRFLCVNSTDNNHCHRRRRRTRYRRQAESTHSRMLIYLLLWIFVKSIRPGEHNFMHKKWSAYGYVKIFPIEFFGSLI